jgi:hypothetical protein
MAQKSYFKSATVLVGMLAAAVLATLVMAVPAWAASNVLVTDVSTGGGATSVAADSNITTTFSKAMRASTIKGSTFYLKKQGSSTTIPARVSYSGTSKTATLNPDSDLEAGATYTATVKGGKRGVRASDGGKLGGTNDSTATFANGKVTWSFMVSHNPTAPSAPSVDLDEASDSGTSSTDNLTNDTTPTFVGTADTGNTVKIYVDGTEKGSATATGGSYSITTSPLTSGTHSVTAKATDAAGNPSAESSALSVTIDTAAPSVGSVSPADTATGVATNTNSEVTFSEDMDPSSITDQIFTLSKPGSTSVAAHVSYDSATKKATLNPDSDLEANTIYKGTITTSVKDKAGNAITQEKNWSFTTADTRITATPNPLSFTSDALCGAEMQLLTVTNNGPDNVTFAGVSITGPDAARFSTGSQQFLRNNGPFTVLAGNFFQDQVTFVPTGGPPQPRTYSATLTYKDGTGATIGSPVTLSAETTCLVFG